MSECPSVWHVLDMVYGHASQIKLSMILRNWQLQKEKKLTHLVKMVSDSLVLPHKIIDSEYGKEVRLWFTETKRAIKLRCPWNFISKQDYWAEKLLQACFGQWEKRFPDLVWISSNERRKHLWNNVIKALLWELLERKVDFFPNIFGLIIIWVYLWFCMRKKSIFCKNKLYLCLVNGIIFYNFIHL